MATTEVNNSRQFSNRMVTFKSPTDPELPKVIDEITNIYMPGVKEKLKPQLQAVIDVIVAYGADRSPGRRLHLTFSTERVSARPAVSIKAQEFLNDVQIKYKVCMFVHHEPLTVA